MHIRSNKCILVCSLLGSVRYSYSTHRSMFLAFIHSKAKRNYVEKNWWTCTHVHRNTGPQYVSQISSDQSTYGGQRCHRPKVQVMISITILSRNYFHGTRPLCVWNTNQCVTIARDKNTGVPNYASAWKIVFGNCVWQRHRTGKLREACSNVASVLLALPSNSPSRAGTTCSQNAEPYRAEHFVASCWWSWLRGQ